MEEAMKQYYDQYKPKSVQTAEEKLRREKMIFLAFTIASLLLATLLYKKGAHKI